MSRLRPIALMHSDDCVDRYLIIMDWAKRRYAYPDAHGKFSAARMIFGTISRLTKIEDMAAAYYMGTDEQHAGIRLRDCPAFPPQHMIGS